MPPLNRITLGYAAGLIALAVYFLGAVGNTPAAFATFLGILGTLVLGPAYTVTVVKNSGGVVSGPPPFVDRD